MKNLSVYSHGPTKSPYLPNGSLIPTQKGDGRNTSMDGAILQIEQLKSTQSKSISGQKQSVHNRTKTTVDQAKITAAQNFQNKINENN